MSSSRMVAFCPRELLGITTILPLSSSIMRSATDVRPACFMREERVLGSDLCVSSRYTPIGNCLVCLRVWVVPRGPVDEDEVVDEALCEDLALC